MICPQCETEYREGFATCADCKVPLVCELPADEESSPEEDKKQITSKLHQSGISQLSPWSKGYSKENRSLSSCGVST